METKKLKVMRGSEKYPELVQEWLESQGANEASDFLFETFNNNRRLYYTMGSRVFSLPDDAISLDYLNYEIVGLEEPKPQPQHVFQPFEHVLVRNHIKDGWFPAHFARIHWDDTPTENGEITSQLLFVTTNGEPWRYCVPFKGNEELYNTQDMPKGGER